MRTGTSTRTKDHSSSSPRTWKCASLDADKTNVDGILGSRQSFRDDRLSKLETTAYFLGVMDEEDKERVYERCAQELEEIFHGLEPTVVTLV